MRGKAKTNWLGWLRRKAAFALFLRLRDEFSWCDACCHKPAIGRLQQQAMRQITLSYCSTPLFRMNIIAGPNENKKDDSATYAQNHRKLFKEITCQADSKYSLCQVRQKFTQELLTFFTDWIHDFSIAYRNILSSWLTHTN